MFLQKHKTPQLHSKRGSKQDKENWHALNKKQNFITRTSRLQGSEKLLSKSHLFIDLAQMRNSLQKQNRSTQLLLEHWETMNKKQSEKSKMKKIHRGEGKQSEKKTQGNFGEVSHTKKQREMNFFEERKPKLKEGAKKVHRKHKSLHKLIQNQKNEIAKLARASLNKKY